MTAIAWHVTGRLTLDRLIADGTAARREAARTLLGLAPRYGLLAFAIPDDHLHLLLACDRVTAGRAANKAEGALVKRLRLPVGFEPARIRPVQSLGHLNNAFHYILRQGAHHQSSGDPLSECTNLWDLLGLRITGAGCIPRVRSALPRLQRAELLAHLPSADTPAVPNPARLADAAAAAIARPDLGGHHPETIAARAAAARLGLELGLTAHATGRLLDTSPRTLRRLARQPARPTLTTAIRRQLALRATLEPQRLSA